VNNLLVGYLFVKPARTPRANPGLRRITPPIREESSTIERAAAARLGAGQGVEPIDGVPVARRGAQSQRLLDRRVGELAAAVAFGHVEMNILADEREALAAGARRERVALIGKDIHLYVPE